MIFQSLKAGDLKALVIRILHQKGPSTVNGVNQIILFDYQRKYAYTTIATILSRLEKEGIMKSEARTINKRRVKIFSLRSDACKEEVTNFLENLFTKFGTAGFKHLGKILDTEMSEDQILSIQEKLNLYPYTVK